MDNRLGEKYGKIILVLLLTTMITNLSACGQKEQAKTEQTNIQETQNQVNSSSEINSENAPEITK